MKNRPAREFEMHTGIIAVFRLPGGTCESGPNLTLARGAKGHSLEAFQGGAGEEGGARSSRERMAAGRGAGLFAKAGRESNFRNCCRREPENQGKPPADEMRKTRPGESHGNDEESNVLSKTKNWLPGTFGEFVMSVKTIQLPISRNRVSTRTFSKAFENISKSFRGARRACRFPRWSHLFLGGGGEGGKGIFWHVPRRVLHLPANVPSRSPLSGASPPPPPRRGGGGKKKGVGGNFENFH